MTTFGDEMRDLAAELNEEFSIGLYEYKTLSPSYNPATGVVTPNPVRVTDIPAAKFDYSEERRVNKTFSEKIWVVSMAGEHLGTAVPIEGGIVVFPDSTEHIIRHVVTDQYGANYLLYVDAKANA